MVMRGRWAYQVDNRPSYVMKGLGSAELFLHVLITMFDSMCDDP